MTAYEYITLRCTHCDKTLCGIARSWIPYESKEGCTRKVTEEDAAQFYHYTEEVIPFWKYYSLEQVQKSYKEIDDFLQTKIYSAPIGQKLDVWGKVKISDIK